MEQHKLWLQVSHQLSSLCARYNDTYFKRDTKLNFELVVRGLIKIKSGGNESYNTIFCDWINPPAASTYCQARPKVPASRIGDIRVEMLESWCEKLGRALTWHNLRVLAIDGSKINVDRKLIDEGFKVSKGSHFPQGLLSILYDVLERTIIDLDFSNNRSERKAGTRLCENLGNGDLVLVDKGYFSIGFLSELADRKIDGLFAIQEGTTLNEIEDFRKSDLMDAIVEIIPSKDSRARAKRNHPDANIVPRKLRLIKFEYAEKTEILATTLLSHDIRAQEIVDLYLHRWRLEELYKVFKTTFDIEKFHSKSANGVEQEIQIASILWNFSRKIADFVPKKHFQKNKSSKSSKISHYQVNWTQALTAVRKNIDVLLDGKGEKLKQVLRLCIQRIIRTILPVRPGRSSPRCTMRPRNRWQDSNQRKAYQQL
jgi:Transposase DDE domain